MTLEYFLSRYQYKPDHIKKDMWEIPKLVNNQYLDDCDGLALGILFYVLANESWFKFWFLLMFTNTKIIYVITSKGIGHVVLKHKGLYIDTYSKAWVSKQQLLDYGHKFHWSRMFLFWQVGIKLGIAKLYSLLKIA